LSGRKETLNDRKRLNGAKGGLYPRESEKNPKTKTNALRRREGKRQGSTVTTELGK